MISEKKLEELTKEHFKVIPISTLLDSVKIEFKEDTGFYDIEYNFNEIMFMVNWGYTYLVYNPIEKEMSIENIHIRPKFQGNGYGKLFVSRIQDLSRTLRCKRVIADNSINDKFWEHLGYERDPINENDLYKKLFF